MTTQYDFSVQNGLFVVTAINSSETFVSGAYSKVSITLLDMFYLSDYGQFKQKFTFDQINLINGIAPVDYADANQKLVDLIPS